MRPGQWFIAGLLFLMFVSAAAAQELIERATFREPRFGVSTAELSPDGKILAAGGGGTSGGELKLWNAATGREIASLPGYKDSLYALAFSADGKRLASGGLGPVRIWDVSSHKKIASFPKPEDGGSWVVALNRDGTRLAAVAGQQVKLWEVASGKELASFRQHIPVYGELGPVFSRDLAILAAGNYQEIDLWDTATGKEKATLSEQRGEVGCMLWSADGKTLIASSTCYQGKERRCKVDVKLWDVSTGKERATLPGPFDCILAMALSPDGKTLALLEPGSSWLSDLKLVDLATGRQRVIRAPLNLFHSLRFTPEGKLLVLGRGDETLRLCEVSLGKKKGKP